MQGKLKEGRRDLYNRAMPLDEQIAFVGAGNMTEALVAGLVKGKVARSDQLLATDLAPERCAHLEQRYRIRVGKDNREAAGWGQVVVLSLEPQVLDEVLDDISSLIKPECLIITVAAGYPIARVAAHLTSATRIVRAMPNTPSFVQAGMTALSFAPGLSETDQRVAHTMFEAVGKVVTVEERLMDAVTGLSGSGPAYVYLMIEALADGGVRMGLPRQVAQLLAAQTLHGAARMVLESGEHPGQLKDRVASPGGTTIAGIHELEKGAFRATLMNAVEAATQRSKELGLDS